MTGTLNFQAGSAPSSPPCRETLSSACILSRNVSPHLSNFLLHLFSTSLPRLCVTTRQACSPSGGQGILLGMPA